jgi:protein-S-isoprenylcysteine O-methyltransferase Ste14
MSSAAFVVFALNFVLIGALPRLFFQKSGRLNTRWWLTASPFIVSAFSVAASALGIDSPVTNRLWDTSRFEPAAVAVAIASIALISFTLGTHHRPIALWHQDNDAPQHLVTHGAYARIRHPFYASFLLALVGSFIGSAQPLALVAALYGIAVLNMTAAREERRLAASAFGAEYRAYVSRTGRFVPRLRAVPRAPAASGNDGPA